jgi:hypothetical protein
MADILDVISVAYYLIQLVMAEERMKRFLPVIKQMNCFMLIERISNLGE